MVNHVWAEGINDLMPAGGFRCGVVPLRDGQEPGVFGGDGDADETERKLANWAFRPPSIQRGLSTLG